MILIDSNKLTKDTMTCIYHCNYSECKGAISGKLVKIGRKM